MFYLRLLQLENFIFTDLWHKITVPTFWEGNLWICLHHMAASYRKAPVLELLLSSTSSNFFRSGYFLRTVTFSEMLVLSITNFIAFILEKLFINRRAFLQVYYELVWLSNSLTPLHKKWGFPLRISQETADLVTFTEEILNGKLQFFVQCSLLLKVAN